MLWTSITQPGGFSSAGRVAVELCVKTLEGDVAKSMGLNIEDPVCNTFLSTMKEEGQITRNQLRAAQAAKTGTPLSLSGLPARLLYLSKSLDQSEGRRLLQELRWITTVPGLIIALLTGKIPKPGIVDAVQTGCWDLKAKCWDKDLLHTTLERFKAQCKVDDPASIFCQHKTLDACLLGSTTDSTISMSPSMADLLGLHQGCQIVSSVLPSHLASYLSHLPNYNDVGLQLGAQEDWIVVPMSHQATDVDRIVFPNPSYDLSKGHDECQPYLSLCKITAAGNARVAVRNRYTNRNWNAFGKMMGAVCAGGVVGMDNKYFTIHDPQENYHSSYFPTDTLKRYEGGQRVVEFSDLRANARCLVEGQGMTIRSLIGKILSQDRELHSKHEVALIPQFSKAVDFAGSTYATGRNTFGYPPLQCDSYDITLTPLRILAWNYDTCADGEQDTLGFPQSFAECLTNIIGGRWVATQEASHGRGKAAQPVNTDYGQPQQPVGAFGQYQHSMPFANAAAMPIARNGNLELGQIRNRALLGGAFFALASEVSTDEGFPGFNAYISSLLVDGQSTSTQHNELQADQQYQHVNTPRYDQPSSGTRARSSSSPMVFRNRDIEQQDTIPYPTSVSFDVSLGQPAGDSPGGSCSQTPTRRSGASSPVQQKDMRRRSASSLSLQARQSFMSFSILEEGDEEGAAPGSSLPVSEVMPAQPQPQMQKPADRMRSKSFYGLTNVSESYPKSRLAGVDSSASLSSLPGYMRPHEGDRLSTFAEGGRIPEGYPIRNRSISLIGQERPPRSDAGDTMITAAAPEGGRRGAVPIASGHSRSSSSTSGSRGNFLASSPIDDNDSPEERQMRAWLQGQLAEPPVFLSMQRSGDDETASSLHRTPSFKQQQDLPASSSSVRERSFSLSSSRGSRIPPSSPITSLESEDHADDSIFEQSGVDSVRQDQGTAAPAMMTAAERLSTVQDQNARTEELLGLQTRARCDEEVWIVYGAFAQEYLRLKSWRNGGHGSVGECASTW
ncbi:unnamed protein product [Sympodiomycopsis kandeliae]